MPPAPRAVGASGRPSSPAALPPEFLTAVLSLREVRLRPELSLSELPPPTRLAPYAHALVAEVHADGEERASGRFVVLHDPEGQPSWQGSTRVVAYARADVDAELAGDPLLTGVGWSWLLEALEAHGAGHVAAGGTVTRTSSARFGELGEPDADEAPAEVADLEVRASWSPTDSHLGQHLAGWCDFLCTAAGLPPAGVAALPARD